MIINNGNIGGNDSGLETRVSALETKTNSMQTQINTNTTNIQNNLSTNVLKATEAVDVVKTVQQGSSTYDKNYTLQKYVSSYTKIKIRVPQFSIQISDLVVPAFEVDIIKYNSAIVTTLYYVESSGSTSTDYRIYLGKNYTNSTNTPRTPDRDTVKIIWNGSTITFDNFHAQGYKGNKYLEAGFTVEYY